MAPDDRPLAIDLFTGAHGWAHGLIKAGFHVIGFDIEDMSAFLGEPKPNHFNLVIQNVLTLNGRQFKDADLIVCSPPCQFFSYVAMPFSKGKERAARTRADPVLLEKELALFNACFRIQRECNEARAEEGKPPMPMVVENVRGAQPWVGRARANFGSFYLFGDVPALMPKPLKAQKSNPDGTNHGTGSWFAIADSKDRGASNGRKLPGFRFDGSGRSFQTASVEGMKVPSESGRRTDIGKGARLTTRDCGVERNAATLQAQIEANAHLVGDGRKAVGSGRERFRENQGGFSSKSPARKAASARIAMIPEVLSEWIGWAWFPRP